MAANCCGKTFSCLFIFFNVIFALVGAATVGFGIYLKVSPSASELQKLVELNTTIPFLGHAAYIIIGFGAFVFLVGLSGCVGAASGNRCLLGLYIFFSILIIVGEIGALVVTVLFVVRSAPIDTFQATVTTTLQKEYRQGRTKYTQPWDHVQVWFKCCGVNNYTDFNASMTPPGWPVPRTCCVLTGAMDPNDPFPKNGTMCKQEAMNRVSKPMYLNAEGCFTKLRDTIMQYSTVLIIVECVIVVITLIGIIIAACLCRRNRDEKNL